MTRVDLIKNIRFDDIVTTIPLTAPTGQIFKMKFITHAYESRKNKLFKQSYGYTPEVYDFVHNTRLH